ncbi:MAG: VTT domain-containing protein [Limisphaerales bacterium]
MERLLQWLPASFETLHPLGQAAILFVSTFVLEDAAALGAGLLLGTGGLTGPVAFWSCFLGIWMGDAGLYALARWLGRPWFEKSRLIRHAAAVRRSEEWFQRRGSMLLVVSRMIPGSRLPTFLAAGFLRVPWLRFLGITGAAALGWTALVLAVSRRFGSWLQAYVQLGSKGVLLLLAGLVVAGFTIGLRKNAARVVAQARAALRARWSRWSRWEFWPAWALYPPVAIYCLGLAIRYRGLSLPAAANPGIFAGGLVGESKMAILRALMATSPDFTAPAALLPKGPIEERCEALKAVCESLTLAPPFILKPDVGQRGAGVRRIGSWDQAVRALRQCDAPMLVQRYSPGPHEVGVFYYRFPNQDRGTVFSITEKVFPEIVGDGSSPIRDLIARDPRAGLIREVYLRRFAARGSEVLAAGEKLRLVEAGNHAQGCIFRDGAHLLTGELSERIDRIARGLDGFFIGRFDIRYADPEAFRAGSGFEIVELNGAGAEATHIYDERNTLGRAYRTLFEQWGLVFAIGAANRGAGHPSLSSWNLLREWIRFRKLAAGYAAAD